MKKKYFWKILSILSLFASLICFFLSWKFYQENILSNNWTTFYGVSGEKTASSYQEIAEKESKEEENALPFALWEQADSQSISTLISGNQAEVTALFIVGDVRSVLPITQTLAIDDGSGCLLDKKTGLQLFGSELPTNVLLKWGEQEYEIRGYFSSPYPLVVFSPSTTDKRILTNITVKSNNTSGFATRQGLDRNQSISGSSFQNKGLFFFLFPLFFFLILFMYYWTRYYKKMKEYPFQWMIWIVSFFLLLTTFSLLFFYLLPTDFFPSKWADFSFWNSTFTHWSQKEVGVEHLATGLPYLMAKNSSQNTLLSLLAAFLLFVSFKATKKAYK